MKANRFNPQQIKLTDLVNFQKGSKIQIQNRDNVSDIETDYNKLEKV